MGTILDIVAPISATDPRLMAEHPISLDRQRRIFAISDRIRQIGHFELLGIEPVDDERSVRRAYHRISREFHPDTYYGRDLGILKPILDGLFRRARLSYTHLLDPVQRAVLVAPHRAKLEAKLDAERERREAEALERAQIEQAATDVIEGAAETERAAAAVQRAEALERARVKRLERDKARHRRVRERAVSVRREQASSQAARAREERDAGRFGAAATLFRLAYELDPTEAEYGEAWRETLAIARRKRAQTSASKAREYLRSGQVREAGRCLADAAEADPNVRNLADAAAVHAEFNPERAREFAIAALEGLQQADAQGLAADPKERSRLLMGCAKAFRAAGQVASATEQARRAHALAPSEQTRALLNRLKLA